MSAEFYPEFIQAFEKSEAGKSLQETYRWSQFRLNEENGLWKKIFGATGQVFTHSILFFNDMRWFLRQEHETFSPDEAETLLWGTAPHDVGEAKINGKGKGDISAQVKTDADEKEEYKIARRVIKSLALGNEAKNRLQEGYNRVVKDSGDEKLHFAFKALEKTEYVLTAMKVYQNCKRLREQGRPAMDGDMEKALVGRVLIIDLPKVIDVYIPKFPKSIGRLFKEAAPLVDEMFTYSLPWLETNNDWKGKPIIRKGKDGKDEVISHKILAEEFKVKWEAFKTRTI